MFCGEEYDGIIKNVETRRLCLEKCVNREILKFDGLKSYFLSENVSEARAKCLKKHYNNPMTKLYVTFDQAVVSVFTIFIKLLQSEALLIRYLHSEQATEKGVLHGKEKQN